MPCSQDICGNEVPRHTLKAERDPGVPRTPFLFLSSYDWDQQHVLDLGKCNLEHLHRTVILFSGPKFEVFVRNLGYALFGTTNNCYDIVSFTDAISSAHYSS